MLTLPILFLTSCPNSFGYGEKDGVAPSEAPPDEFSLYENREDSWVYWTYDQFKFFAPQGWDAIWEIGPVDAATSGVIGIGLAEYTSAELWPDEPASGEHRNAFRHCYGSCLDYQLIGDDALVAMDIHERYGASLDEGCDSAIDRFNNDVGVSYAKTDPDGSCYDFCTDAIGSGGLMLVPGNPDSAENDAVSATCR